MPKQLVKVPSLIYTLKIESMEVHGKSQTIDEKPQILDEILGNRVTGVPLRDGKVKLKSHEYTFYASVMDGEEIEKVKQYFVKSSIPQAPIDNNSEEEQILRPLRHSLGISKAEIPTLKSVILETEKKNLELVARSDKQSSLPDFPAQFQKVLALVDSKNEAFDEKKKENRNDKAFHQAVSTKLTNMTSRCSNDLVPIEIDPKSHPFDLKIIHEGRNISVMIHNLKMTKQTNGEHNVLMEILKNQRKLFVRFKSPLEISKGLTLVEFVSHETDLTEEILKKCFWIKPFRMMAENLIVEELTEKMTFEFEKMGKNQNEIFAVRASYRNYLENELIHLKDYLEIEFKLMKDLIVITQNSLNADFLFRAKISRISNTKVTLEAIDYINEIEIIKDSDGWSLLGDKSIKIKMFKFPICLQDIPKCVYSLKIQGIPAKPVTKPDLLNDIFEVDDESMTKFKIRTKKLSSNQVTLKTQKAKNFEKVLLVHLEGFQSLYENLENNVKYEGTIADIDDHEVIWIMLKSMENDMNLMLQILSTAMDLLANSKNLNLDYKPKVGEICYFKDDQELLRLVITFVSQCNMQCCQLYLILQGCCD